MTNDTKWSIDPSHSEIAFKVRHLMVAHIKGSFKTFEGSIYTTGKNFETSVIDLWIDVSSITTGDEKRDEHLIGSDFFDIQKHAQISFTSSMMGAANAAGKHELWGALTMKGITKNIQLEVVFGGIQKDPWGNEKAGFEVSGKINRSEWGLVWNTILETGGVMLSEEVTISADIELLNLGAKEMTMELIEQPGKSIF